jgi:hypothetical protein
MRNRGESLAHAARAEHTTPHSVRKIVGTQLKRRTSGRYMVTTFDKLRRDLSVLSWEGYIAVSVRSSKQAQIASAHLTQSFDFS